MSVPLDRLYHYIKKIAEQIRGDSVIIYRFWPHGSKNIENLLPLTENDCSCWRESQLRPSIYCNDQEPLDYDRYQEINPGTLNSYNHEFGRSLLRNIDVNIVNFRLYPNIYDKTLLLHSELRSKNLEQYQDSQFLSVYYWSHAVIALDWFRYAQHVPREKNVQKTFLIYNRAWAGTREYRLKFLEILVRLGLENHCQTTVSPIEPELEIHYNQHQFKNPTWRPTCVLENYFPTNCAKSHYSADFDIDDYNATDIEVVLETLFDDQRLHLTEKSLRPIACGQPFILAGTHGSLDYLRRYGFKTFEHLWDESYDNIEDPHERLTAISAVMKQIANWDYNTKENKMAQARLIAEYNQQHFFSDNFFTEIANELKNNLADALTELEKTNTNQLYLDRWRKILSVDEVKTILSNTQAGGVFPSMLDIESILKQIKQ
jgi:hypothetical protein